MGIGYRFDLIQSGQTMRSLSSVSFKVTLLSSAVASTAIFKAGEALSTFHPQHVGHKPLTYLSEPDSLIHNCCRVNQTQ